MQGCGSVLATTNLNNISFQMSKRQRSSSSQDFVKPRMIARPILLSSCSTSSTLAPGATLQEPHLNAGAVDRTSCHSSAHAEHDDALTIEPETDSTTSQQDEAMLGWLGSLQLRYFTPREVANLHSFPASFDFPQGVTRKQQYALLGNSLSVAVVSHLLTYLMS